MGETVEDVLRDLRAQRRKPRIPVPWYRAATNSWYVSFDGKQIRLGKSEREAADAYWRLANKLASAGPRGEKQQVIYFIQDLETGNIKIGISDDPMRRLRVLQTGSAHRLALLGTIVGNRSNEEWMHGKFRASRLQGEWFQETPELLAIIAEYCG